MVWAFGQQYVRIDRYEVGPAIGAGSFATVYHGRDPRLNAPVAIKVLAEAWSADPDVRRRFGQEASLLRRVRSEFRNAPLVEVFDIDEADGRPYFVMTFADRGTLADRFVAGVPWPANRAGAVVEALAAGMTALHTVGVVHRDLKPSNLLYVTATGTPDNENLLIGDLGLAKDLLASGSGLTIAGGSPGYMAPEQINGAAPVTPQADIHAASMVVLELVSGVRGAAGLERVPTPVATELERGLAIRPAARHEGAHRWAADVLGALAASTEAEAPVNRAPEPPVPRAGTEPVDRRPTILVPPPAAPTPTAGASAAPSSTPSRLGNRWRVGLVSAVLALAAAIGAVLAIGALGESDPIDIDGPASATVGRPVVLVADVPDEGTHVWVVGDDRVADQDLQLTPRSVGTIEVRLDYRTPEGETVSADHTIDVGP